MPTITRPIPLFRIVQSCGKSQDAINTLRVVAGLLATATELMECVVEDHYPECPCGFCADDTRRACIRYDMPGLMWQLRSAADLIDGITPGGAFELKADSFAADLRAMADALDGHDADPYARVGLAARCTCHHAEPVF